MVSKPQKKSAVVTQSNYIPWKGYFDMMRVTDEFVLFDDAQFTRRDWRNRNRIKTPAGTQWLTIPVESKGNYFEKIKDIKISESDWNVRHWKTICFAYGKAPFFKEYKDFFEDLYRRATSSYLSEINFLFLKEIAKKIGINHKLRFSSDFVLEEGRNEKIIGICKQIRATDYYTGPMARGYIEPEMFHQNDIRVTFFDFNGYPTYSQLHPPFDHSVSILDLMFQMGPDLPKYFKESPLEPSPTLGRETSMSPI